MTLTTFSVFWLRISSPSWACAKSIVCVMKSSRSRPALTMSTASWKSWLYLLSYPLFIYTWIPITAIGFFKRNQHVWSHTLHTRAIGFNDVVIPEDVVHVGPKQVILTKALK